MSDTEPTSFFRPGKLILLLLLGLVVYACALVVNVPAGWAWQQVSGQVVLPPQIRVHQVSGKLWHGAAAIHFAGIPARVSWRLDWPSLSQAQVPVALSVDMAQSSLQAQVLAHWSGHVALSASGTVAVAEFRELIRRSGGAMLEGEVTIDRISLTLDNGQLIDASGIARWPGGAVTWPMGRQTGSAVFPAMQATLDRADDAIQLAVSEQGGDGPAAEARVLPNGMLDIRVFKRMVDLAGQPWSDSAQPSDVVFRVRQPLLPGGR